MGAGFGRGHVGAFSAGNGRGRVDELVGGVVCGVLRRRHQLDSPASKITLRQQLAPDCETSFSTSTSEIFWVKYARRRHQLDSPASTYARARVWGAGSGSVHGPRFRRAGL